MARMLGRSRSLRILRSANKESHQQDNGMPTPPPTNPQVHLERLKASTPVTSEDRRVETTDMLQRPKTSGGPGDRGKLFHKKTIPVALGSEDQHLNFPFPSPTKSSTTLLYTAEINESREGVIGIALGSPTMASHWNSPHSTDFVTNNTGTFTEITSNNPLPARVEVKQEAPKPKLSRWKSIFKKSQPPPEQKPSFYQLAQSVVPTRADSHHDNESLDSRTTAQLDETKDESGATSPPTFRPEIRESRKVPKGQIQPLLETRPRALTLATIAANQSSNRSTILRSSSSPQVPAKDVGFNSPTVPQVVVSEGSSSGLYASPTSMNGKSLLDVDIPTIKMERYSVMFGNLLQPSSDMNSNRSSSLLVRRQGNADRLKPLNELSAKKDENSSKNGGLKPQRRATSPSLPPRSPLVTLSLFPQPAGNSRAPSPRASSTNRTGRLQRSKTAPTVSPSRLHFPFSEPSTDVAKEMSQGPQVSERPEDANSLEQAQDTKWPEQETDLNVKSQLLSATPSSRNSFESAPESVTILGGNATSPKALWKTQSKSPNEPEWEIISKPSRRPSHRELREALSSHPANAVLGQPKEPSSAPLDNSRAGFGSKPPTPQTAEAAASAPRSADRLGGITSPLKPQGSKAPPATVGVARSISVSRASPRGADLLKPILVTRSTDSSERLVDTRALTPTLVELKNRKSQRVQLVDA